MLLDKKTAFLMITGGDYLNYLSINPIHYLNFDYEEI